MSSRAVQGQLSTDADADDHEAELVVEAIGQHLAQVIFDHREDDRKQRHRAADQNQFFSASESSSQSIDRQLRRKRT